MANLETLIPGLAEAEATYRESQLEAFLDVEPAIGEMVYLAGFTPQMHIELERVGNLCVVDGPTPGHTDVLQFLWRCSIAFERNNVEKRREFWQACSLLPYAETVGQIEAYLVRAWKGQPHWSSGGVRSAGVWPSMIVHVVASAYGWPEAQILNTPFRRLWQYIHRILEEKNPDYRHINMDVMRLRSEWLRKLNAGK